MMGRSNSELHVQHQAVYRLRRKLDLQPLRKPWDYLTASEVKAMAWMAYRVASWYLREDAIEQRVTHQELRGLFAESLAEMFKDALSAHAVTEGFCWPVDDKTPAYRNYPLIWQQLAQDVPDTWRPEYPLYQEVTPASAANAPGAVTNLDEGKADERNFRA